MAVDWFLLIIIIVMTFVLLIGNVYILVYFQHDDDKNTAYFPKALVVRSSEFLITWRAGLRIDCFFSRTSLVAANTVWRSLLKPPDLRLAVRRVLCAFAAAGCVVLMDTCYLLLRCSLRQANNSSAIGCAEGWNTACGNINMDLLWLIVFMSIIIIIVVLLPYSMYYYEADDGEDNVGNAQWLEALKMEVATLVVAIALFVVLYVTVSKSHIPMRALEINSLSPSRGFHAYTDGMTLAADETGNATLIDVQSIKVTLDVSFPVYITGLVSFIGWFGFCIFCGIGLIALPLDLILSFAHRPKFISADVYAHQKLCIQKRSLELIELGKSIKASMERPGQGNNKTSWERKKQKRLDFVTLNKFKQSVYLLESDMDELKLCHEDYKNYNPLVAVFKLILGCISAFVSAIWIFHIALYMLPPVPLVPFLNTYFIWFDQWFPLFGTISVGIFSAYLLACAVKGCFKFGMRCFCFALHPMKLHGTYMNSMLFNLGLVLSCSIPVVQFCDEAFQDYGRLTSIRTMMGNQIHYLQGMSFFWEYNIFVYAILAFSLLTMLFLIAKPKDNSSPVDEIRKKIERQVRETRSV